MLIGLIINLTFGGFVFAQDTQTRATEKAKISVAKFGTGGKLTEVKLNDGTKIKGYITEIKDDRFVLVSKKNGASVNVPYNEVKNVRRTFTTFQRVVVITGVTLAVIVLIPVICLASGNCVD